MYDNGISMRIKNITRKKDGKAFTIVTPPYAKGNDNRYFGSGVQWLGTESGRPIKCLWEVDNFTERFE